MLKSVFWGALLITCLTICALLVFLPTSPISVGGSPQSSKELVVRGQQSNSDQEIVSENSFVLQNARLFDGEVIHDNMDIIVRDGIILTIGAGLQPPENFRVMDVTGKTLIPGLIDTHTHSWGSALADALQFGVTTNIDMFTMPSMLPSTIKARFSVGRTKEASLYSAGMLATAPNGHGTQFGTPVETLTGPEEAGAWVDKRLAEGSDFIKLVYNPYINYLPSLSRETAKAVIDAAHKRGVLAVAHISTQREALDMVEDGIDGLVHIFADEPVSQVFIDLALKNEVFVIPTLAILSAADEKNLSQAYIDNPLVGSYLSSTQRQSLGQRFPPGGIPGFDYDIGLDNIRQMHKAGIVIFAGSDAPNPGTAHGVSVHHEMALLVDAGMSPIEAMKSATSAPAAQFGLLAGRIREGMKADMVLLSSGFEDGDYATLDIDTVYRNGYSIERVATENPKGMVVTYNDLGTFEDGLTSPQNFIWTTTTDEMISGTSKATLSLVEGKKERVYLLLLIWG